MAVARATVVSPGSPTRYHPAMDAVAIPVLPCRDLDRALAFYGALGFRLVYEQGEPDPYAIVDLHGAEVHLFVAPGLEAERSLHGCYLRVFDADTVHREWSARGLPPTGLPRLGPLGDLPSGMREFELVDLDGNRLRVGHLIE